MIIRSLQLSEKDLLIEVRAHHRAGAEELYDRYADALLLAILRLVPGRESAQTILCKTFKIAWETICTYQEQQLSLLAWMRRIAIQQAGIHCEANIILNSIHL